MSSGPTGEGAKPEAPKIVFKKRSRPASIRQKPVADDTVEEGAIKRIKPEAPRAPAQFSSKTTKEQVDRLKFNYEGTGEIQERGDSGATRVLETETAFDNDARAQRERFLAQGPAEDGQYKGQNNYKDWKAGFRREGTVTEEKSGGAHGPMRATQYMRASVRMDYQPDICKDYKETGFCSYGDTCKFLHDRGDYKSGWELEKEFAAQQKARQQAQIDRIASGKPVGQSSDEESDEDELPFACYICRRPWAECQDPVLTRCEHYFCEQCALKHNAKSPNCFVCEKLTGGIFNVAAEILKKVKSDAAAAKPEGDAAATAPAIESDAAATAPAIESDADANGGGWSAV